MQTPLHYSRRKFLKQSAISTAGIIAAPKYFLPAGELKFLKAAGDRIFRPAAGYGNVQAFVYVEPSYTDTTFLLSQAFHDKATFNDKFVVVFYKNQLPAGNELNNFIGKVKKYLDEQEGSITKCIIWVDCYTDDCLDAAFGNCSILANGNNEVKQLPGAVGNDPKYTFLLDQNQSNAVISYAIGANALLVKPQNTGVFEIKVAGTIATVNSLEIPVVHFRVTGFGFPSLVQNASGSIRFRTTAFLDRDNPLQPCSPYLIPDKNQTIQIRNVNYFQNESLADNTYAVITFFPYPNFKNGDSQVTSIEYGQTGQVKTTFADQFGKPFQVGSFSKFIGHLTRITFDEEPKYLFVTSGTLLIKNRKAGPSNLLLGYSGTERLQVGINGLNIPFKSTPLILLSGNKLSSSGESFTSRLSFDQNSYFLDADKQPMFDNANPEYTVSQGGRAVPYFPVAFGNLRTSNSYPVLPSLAFSISVGSGIESYLENSLKLEAIFVKNRQKGVITPPAPTAAPARISPSGFTQKGNLYDYINHVDVPAAKQNPPLPKYQFTITDGSNRPDFQLSVNREEVFFVVTPKMMENLQFVIDFKAFLGIREFDVDAIFKASSATNNNTDKDRIIIVKYSRHFLNELVHDTSRWTNYGTLIPNNGLDAQRKIIETLFDEFTQSGRGNNDYDYINRTVRTDPNWNGVLILNIPIADHNRLPAIFSGLAASQNLQPNSPGNLLQLTTGMNFRYVALPVNKTIINPTSKLVEIKTSSVYALIDYDVLTNDYKTVHDHFVSGDVSFVMTKLLIRFENNAIKNFQSYAFVRMSLLFDEDVDSDGVVISNAQTLPSAGDVVKKVFRLDGHYQETSSGSDEFTFNITGKIDINFQNSSVLQKVTLKKASFSIEDSGDSRYRFDFDGDATFQKDFGAGLSNLINFDGISFSNIGLSFKSGLSIPKFDFDFSKLLILPDIDFDKPGLLNSFPVKFNRFQLFQVDGNLKPQFDFLSIPIPKFEIKVPNCRLWSLIFDFDLGTLGALGNFGGLKAEFLFGWSIHGGMTLAIRLNGPSIDSLHIDLFGALGLDIDTLRLCIIPGGKYLIRINHASLTILGTTYPKGDATINAMIFGQPGNKIAWLLTYTNDKNNLVLGAGQHVGIEGLPTAYTVDKAIQTVKGLFNPALDPCGNGIADTLYHPENGWLVASEDLLPSSIQEYFNFKFIFNDPVLYGALINLVGLFSIDILYKKLSEHLGVWSLEFALDPSLRVIDAGEVVITLPNIGISISTVGDWKFDIGFPVANDWSRSCLIQLRPFVGWAGIYGSKLRSAELSLFKDYQSCLPDGGVDIIQSGMAIRVGIGAYIDKGILYLGASISVYGIMEGAFAFDKTGKTGMSKVFPDHFALMGRIGAIAEVVGYVDFKLIKAAIHILLQVEVGMTIVYLTGKKAHGLQPVPLYIEGIVQVSIDFTIACFKIFGHHFCITLHFSFHTGVRFDYNIGGGSSCHQLNYVNPITSVTVPDLKEIPIMLIPTFTAGADQQTQNNYLIYNFTIPFFGLEASDGHLTKVSGKNIIKDRILYPIFNAIPGLAAGKMNYEQVKSLLLGKKASQSDPDVDFLFPHFLPVFLSGFEKKDVDDPDFDKFLQDYFDIDISAGSTELKDYYNNIGSTNCGASEGSCLYRTIPVPISSKVKVVEKNGNFWKTDQNGFTVVVEGLIDQTDPLKTKFKTDPLYDNNKINKIRAEFTNSKSQFSDSQNPDSDYLADVPKDIREELAIQEFFRLMALIMLEMYYQSLSGHQSNKNKADFNPVIDITKLFADPSVGWTFLGPEIDSLIAQVNYFYNNGLRLKKLLDNDQDYTSYYSLIRQATSIAGIKKGVVNLSDVKISLQSASDSSKVTDITADLFTDTNSFNDFLSTARAQLAVDPVEMVKNQFRNPHNTAVNGMVVRPYELVNLKPAIGLHDYSGVTASTAFRYFPAPDIISGKFTDGQKCALKVFCVENGNKPADPVQINHVVCTNALFTVKSNKTGNEITSLELSGVNAEDLNLLNNLTRYHNDITIKSIGLYIAGDKTLTLIQNNGLTVIKTNLSPKTHPPVIIPEHRLNILADPGTEKYYADIHDDPTNFLRLIWEGLTTNDGGYYLTNTADTHAFAALPDTKNNYKMLISVEVTDNSQASIAHGFHNVLKVIDSGGTIFNALDTNSHLYCEVFTNKTDSSGNMINVQEYHQTIPAHCLAFELERNGKEDFKQYIPIDYAIDDRTSGINIVQADNAFPMMPRDKKKDGAYDPGNVYYNHVAPLITYNDGEACQNRYTAVGHQILVNFTLRDLYGFRFTNINLPINYKHVYFDKLIPVHAWPYINAYYWIPDASNPSQCEMTLSVNKTGLLQIKDENKLSIKKQLYSIKAQLSDARCTVAFGNINPQAPKNLPPTFQATGIISVINQVLYVLGDKIKGSERSESFKQTGPVTMSGFRTELNVNLIISRGDDQTLFTQLPDGVDKNNVLEYDMIKKMQCPLPLSKSAVVNKDKKITDAANDLNLDLMAVKSNYTVGIGTSGNNHVVYLIDCSKLVVCNNVTYSQSDFYAVRPYANKPWSGTYQSSGGGNIGSYDNVDLDQSLRTVLSVIDKTLDGQHVHRLPLASMQKLIKAKKMLVKGGQSVAALADASAELSNRTELLSQSTVLHSKEFEDYLLEKAGNYYNADGIIFKGLNSSADLKEHRLTVKIDAVSPDPAKKSPYQVDSSKIYFKGDNTAEWLTIFQCMDKSKVDPSGYAYTANVSVTHIEYEINEISEYDNGIEMSRWIQLLTPVSLSGQNISNFPVITRECPPDPVIVKNAATQSYPESRLPAWNKILGDWYYQIEIADGNFYKDNDVLYIKLNFKAPGTRSLRPSTVRNFPGFIAYWSATDIGWDTEGDTGRAGNFITDIESELSKDRDSSPNLIPSPDLNDGADVLLKLQKTTGGWKIADLQYNPSLNTSFFVTTPANLEHKYPVNTVMPDLAQIAIGGMNIFKAPHLMSGKPSVWATRNEQVNNKNFRYVTDIVSPSGWTTVHIRYLNAILQSGGLTAVFKDIFEHSGDVAGMKVTLPFKSTIKYPLKTADLLTNRGLSLPVISICQLEFQAGSSFNENIDGLFIGNYENGYPAMSLTVSNYQSDVDNDLPVFTANTIFEAS